MSLFSKNLIAIFLSVLFLAGNSQAGDFSEKLFQGKIWIGMPLADFNKNHNKVILMKTLPGQRESYDCADIVSRFTIQMYYIRGGRLVGFMRTSQSTQLNAKQKGEEELLTNPERSGEFVEIKTSRAARATKDLQMEVIEVVNWKSKTDSLQLYSVAAPSELTIIVFDPTKLSWRDFFVGPEIENDLKATRARVNGILNGGKDASKVMSKFEDSNPSNSGSTSSSKVSESLSFSVFSDLRFSAIALVILGLVAVIIVFIVRMK